jgi:dTDP-glucose 4,6-dehydratase
MKNILVTGSAGFIGCNFIHYILNKDKNINIISLDKLTYAGNKKNLENLSDPDRHKLIQGDICDRNLVDKILKENNIDTIVHFAAESHVDRSITGPAAFVETNVVGTFTLLEAAREHKCHFHHVSTDEVYGHLGKNDPAFAETTPYDPSSPYSASKAASDHFVNAYHRTYGLPITMSNCSNNYGPYQHDEKLIPTVIRSCVQKQPIPVYGDGSNIRDWLYVDDHCDAIYTILTKGKIGETYNVGGNCEKNNLDLVKTICSIMDKQRPIAGNHEDLIAFVKDRPGHDWRYAINNNKILTELNWKPSYDFATGILNTIKFYLTRYQE